MGAGAALVLLGYRVIPGRCLRASQDARAAVAFLVLGGYRDAVVCFVTPSGLKAKRPAPSGALRLRGASRHVRRGPT